MNDSKECADDEMKDKLQSWFSGYHKLIITGIGNPIRKDDFIGVLIVRGLKDKVPSSVCLIECETVPESFLESIIGLNPSHILIIDAALLNLEHGASKLVSPEELQERQAISTHALPLRIFCQYLAQTTEAKIALLLIQPKDTSFGEDLSPELTNTAEHLIKVLSTILEA